MVPFFGHPVDTPTMHLRLGLRPHPLRKLRPTALPGTSSCRLLRGEGKGAEKGRGKGRQRKRKGRGGENNTLK